MAMDKNIEKARALYLERGVLKREVLRDDVVYSWVRSRLLNLDFQSPPQPSVPQKKDLSLHTLYDALSLSALGVDAAQIDIVTALHTDSEGKILNVWAKSPKHRHYFNFAEESMGTNALALTIKNKKKSMIRLHEHYHDYLTQSLTMAVPTSAGGAVGFVISRNCPENELVHFFNRLPESLSFESLQPADRNEPEKRLIEKEQEPTPILPWPACLAGTSPSISIARSRLEKLRDSELIFITGPKGIGKETTAHHLHRMKTRSDLRFHSIYCDRMPFQRFSSDWLSDPEELIGRMKVHEIGTLYFENFDALPARFQRKFMRILDSKLVNRIDENPWRISDLQIIISLSTKPREIAVEKGLTGSLQSRLRMVEVNLPALSSRREDLCPILEQMLREKGVTDDRLQDLKELGMHDVLGDMNMNATLRDMDRLARQIAGKLALLDKDDPSSDGAIFSPEDCDSAFSPNVRTLEEVEERAIREALEALSYNVKKTAKALGISRSTLYRKLECYGIEPMTVRE